MTSTDYVLEDGNLRGYFLGSQGSTEWTDIARRTGAPKEEAHRIAWVRASASTTLVTAWLTERVLSWRQLARIALIDAPFDEPRQLAMARTIPACARFLDRALPAERDDGEGDAPPLGPHEPPTGLRRIK